ncbi:MAG: YggS family pyridoxal phosphate-dependent enzyme [Pseudoxanthomonas sp.]
MLAERFTRTLHQLQDVAVQAHQPTPRLLAVSKTQPAEALAELAAAGQRAFGENYVQEAQQKIIGLQALELEWHLIGHLQSNKAAVAAELFDWVQTVDRAKLVDALGKARAPARTPLNVLIQVNVDGEAGKQGCRPDEIPGLAAAIGQYATLKLRGLMAIPTPHETLEDRRPAFRAMKRLFDDLAQHAPGIDTLSMGMSDDAALAVAEGATLVRIGTALFGARPSKAD